MVAFFTGCAAQAPFFPTARPYCFDDRPARVRMNIMTTSASTAATSTKITYPAANGLPASVDGLLVCAAAIRLMIDILPSTLPSEKRRSCGRLLRKEATRAGCGSWRTSKLFHVEQLCWWIQVFGGICEGLRRTCGRLREPLVRSACTDPWNVLQTCAHFGARRLLLHQ